MSKLGLNQSLLNQRMKDVYRTGVDRDDVILTARFLLRKCFNCGKQFKARRDKNFIYCVECGKIRKNRKVRK